MHPANVHDALLVIGWATFIVIVVDLEVRFI